MSMGAGPVGPPGAGKYELISWGIVTGTRVPAVKSNVYDIMHFPTEEEVQLISPQIESPIINCV